MPANLRDRPTLITQLNNKGTQNQTVELSYLTGGLGWKADYVAELNGKENRLDLSGWVTLTNTSGASYKKAKLQLVAGDVNRVQRHMRRVNSQKTCVSDMVMAEAAAPMSQEGLCWSFIYIAYNARPPSKKIKQNRWRYCLLVASLPLKSLSCRVLNITTVANTAKLALK